MLFTGHCHCGNIRFEFGSAFTPTSLALRACQCSFCRAHGAVTVSDPAGQARLFIGERERVQYYRFGLNVTDMLICTHCG
ncbi:MAG: GFA family protein, partial [Gammaproteobacteria bacterium]